MSAPEEAAGTPAAGPAHFDLRYRLKLGDYAAAVDLIGYTPFERVTLALCTIGLITTGTLLGVLFWFGVEAELVAVSRKTGFGLSISIAITALLYLYYFVLWPAQFRSSFRQLPVALGESRLVADDKGVTQTVAEIELFAPWNAIRRIEETRTHVILFLTPAASFVIPKKSFPDAAQATRFLALARAPKV